MPRAGVTDQTPTLTQGSSQTLTPTVISPRHRGATKRRFPLPHCRWSLTDGHHEKGVEGGAQREHHSGLRVLDDGLRKP